MADQLLQQIVNSLLIGSVYALVAIGLTLIWGVMNVLNFAHGDFLMIGMFVSFWCYTLLKMDPLFSIPVCAAVLFLLGAGIYRFIISKNANSNVRLWINGQLVVNDWPASGGSGKTGVSSAAITLAGQEV